MTDRNINRYFSCSGKILVRIKHKQLFSLKNFHFKTIDFIFNLIIVTYCVELSWICVDVKFVNGAKEPQINREYSLTQSSNIAIFSFTFLILCKFLY